MALAQRIMDDIIDLELEKIERIMTKIDEDPENEEVKHAERALWEKIYKKSGQGRRTGVGITAEGDMLAALGLRYGTEEATEFSEKVHKTVALGAYRSSVEMAKERGAFEIYNSEREQNNPCLLYTSINNGNTLPKITRNASQKVTSGCTSTKGKRIGTAIAAPIFAINV